jgi:hypothetical protein
MPSCSICGKKAYSDRCVAHKVRQPIATKTPIRRPTKRIKQQSDRELEYQAWKETVARPALIERDGNNCSCCGRSAFMNEKLDIEHTLTKGSRPDLKRDPDNLTLMDRICHHYKTIGQPCPHTPYNIDI